MTDTLRTPHAVLVRLAIGGGCMACSALIVGRETRCAVLSPTEYLNNGSEPGQLKVKTPTPFGWSVNCR